MLLMLVLLVLLISVCGARCQRCVTLVAIEGGRRPGRGISAGTMHWRLLRELVLVVVVVQLVGYIATAGSS